jgi:hypothetical protein
VDLMPTAVSDQERVRRVREEGSRRKRDLAAVRRVQAKERRERLELARSDAGAAPVVAEMARRIAAAVPESTFKIWFDDMRCVGGDGTTLLLTASEGKRAWIERRYDGLLREALCGTDSSYTDVEFVDVGEVAR